MTDARWPIAVRAAACLVQDPLGLGGVHLRARAGDVREAWLTLTRQLAGGAARLHTEIADTELFGGLDLTETLRLGRQVTRTGLIDRFDALILPMAERTPAGLAARLGQVLDGGRHCLIALDEGVEAEERLPIALADRLALAIDLDGLRSADMPALEPLPAVDALSPEDAMAQLAALSMTLGIASARRTGLALRLARASAAVDGRPDVSEADIGFATTVCLLSFATQLPQPQDEQVQDTHPEPEPEPDTAEQDTPDGQAEVLPDGDILLEAILASVPPDLLARLAKGSSPRASGTGVGATRRGNRRGRPIPSRAGHLDGRSRIDLVATLRAAAPWQRTRGGGPGKPVQVRASDLRLRRYETRSDRLVIFTVDASGSAAFARLGEVKGAVELLLAEAYARRDHVALVSFRGETSEILLPPTRSLVRTKRELSGLPGGGGTPLAAGLRKAAELAAQARGRGMDPAIVIMTDGRPNIALSGAASRSAAQDDATSMARLIRAQHISGMVIDAGNRPTPALALMAAQMDAPYLPLPRADAAKLNASVASALQ